MNDQTITVEDPLVRILRNVTPEEARALWHALAATVENEEADESPSEHHAVAAALCSRLDAAMVEAHGAVPVAPSPRLVLLPGGPLGRDLGRITGQATTPNFVAVERWSDHDGWHGHGVEHESAVTTSGVKKHPHYAAALAHGAKL